jgi:hypothetical protein
LEVKTARTGSMSELSDAELIKILLRGSLDEIIEAVLVYRGYAPLTSGNCLCAPRGHEPDCDERSLPVISLIR